jgi:hypothetical protein
LAPHRLGSPDRDYGLFTKVDPLAPLLATAVHVVVLVGDVLIPAFTAIELVPLPIVIAREKIVAIPAAWATVWQTRWTKLSADGLQ